GSPAWLPAAGGPAGRVSSALPVPGRGSAPPPGTAPGCPAGTTARGRRSPPRVVTRCRSLAAPPWLDVRLLRLVPRSPPAGPAVPAPSRLGRRVVVPGG